MYGDDRPGPDRCRPASMGPYHRSRQTEASSEDSSRLPLECLAVVGDDPYRYCTRNTGRERGGYRGLGRHDEGRTGDGLVGACSAGVADDGGCVSPRCRGTGRQSTRTGTRRCRGGCRGCWRRPSRGLSHRFPTPDRPRSMGAAVQAGISIRGVAARRSWQQIVLTRRGEGAVSGPVAGKKVVRVFVFFAFAFAFGAGAGGRFQARGGARAASPTGKCASFVERGVGAERR